MDVNPARFFLELLRIFQNVTPQLLALFEAIVNGLSFAADNPSTAPHIEYHLRQCAGTNTTYFEDAIRFVRQLGEQVRRGPISPL